MAVDRGAYNTHPRPFRNSPHIALIAQQYDPSNIIILVLLIFGYATSHDPTLIGMATFPIPPNRNGMIRKNIIVIPCTVINILYISGESCTIPFWAGLPSSYLIIILIIHPLIPNSIPVYM